ncbi:MAG: DUF3106 domain-containing protein [Acidobacteriaceae bacterium]
MRTGNNSSGPGRWLVRIALSALLLAGPAFCWGSPHRGGRGWAGSRGGFAAFQSHDQRGRAERDRTAEQDRGERPAARPDNGREARRGPQPETRPAVRPGNRQETQRGSQPETPATHQEMQRESRPETRQPVGPAGRAGTRSGQEHLPAWWQAHRGLSPQQQADALRRQPGFRSLPQGQQQRLIQRLHEFDRRPPAQQQRMMDRVEMFERLSPERQQEIRGASQALSRMPQVRQRAMRHAFRELRGMPPEERRQMLHSGYGAQFTPQERTVLGNLLSIEPYQGQGQIIQPYFGRR